MGLRAKEQLSIEITDAELRLLWFIPGWKGIRMTPVMFETIPLSPGIIEHANVRQPMEFTRILEKCLASRGIKDRVKVRIGIPLSNGFLREYNLPWVPKRERFQLFSYLADEEIPIPAKERLFDYFIVEDNPSQRNLRVILSGIRRSDLHGIASCFETAGFKIEQIGFSAIAWARVLDFPPKEYTLLLKEHTGLLQLILYKGQIPEIIRTIPSKLSLGIEERRLEIQRILAYFSTLDNEIKIKQIITVAGTEAENLGRRLSDYLHSEKGMKPIFHILDEGIVFEPRLEIGSVDRERILAVTGMALEISPAMNNFWKGEIQRKIGYRRTWVAILLLFVFSLAGLGYRGVMLQKVSELEQEVVKLETIGQGLTSQGNRQGEKALAWSAVVKNPSTAGQDLIQIQGLASIGIQFERLEYKEDLLLIKGTASDPILVQSVTSALQKMGWEKTRLINYRQDQNSNLNSGRIEFSLTAEPLRKQGNFSGIEE